MKRAFLSLSLITLLSLPAVAGNWFGAGPWANDGYYPGYLNGKYQASVTGLNIIGVVGFSIVDGAPPSREIEEQAANAGGPVLRNVALGVDPFQNYFLIFHEGQTYRGETLASIDLVANTVTGALRGTDPAAIQPFTATAGVNAVVNALPVVNRGLSGGFLASIQDENALLTFSGDGQLSSQSNPQAVSITAVPAVYDPADVPPSPAGTITNLVVSGQVATTSTPFSIRGMRTSYFASNAVSSASLIGQ
jgi:hypothetical protein